MAFTLTAFLPGVGEEHAHVATATIVAGALIATGFAARASLGTGDTAVIPADRFSIRGAFELLTEFIRGLCDTVIGEEGRDFIPLFCSVFLFALVNNLMGVVPGMEPATENLNTTLAMGVFIFLYYNFHGLRSNGIGYLKHFMGPILWLAPFMFIIEVISHLVRPVSLGLRLANVMRGDHTVVGIFLDLIPIGLPVPFYLLGIFICFVQAFVFTLLSMVYVAMAVAHEH